MSCEVTVDDALEEDILDCGDLVCDEFEQFMLDLQDNPLPAARRPHASRKDVFWQQLPCGYYVQWEIYGDLLALAMKRPAKNCLVRISGFGRGTP